MNEDIQKYKDAVWDFLMEHSDILESGAVFVKFHTSGRRNFENRVIGRLKYGYHRGDPVEKNKTHEGLRKHFEETKRAKKERYEKEKKKRKTYLWKTIQLIKKRFIH